MGLIRQIEVFETPYAASSRMPPSGPQLFVRTIATLLQADVMLLWTGSSVRLILRAGGGLPPGGFPATPFVTPNSLLLMLELWASAGLTNRLLGFRDGRGGVTTTPPPINQSAFRRFGSPSSHV